MERWTGILTKNMALKDLVRETYRISGKDFMTGLIEFCRQQKGFDIHSKDWRELKRICSDIRPEKKSRKNLIQLDKSVAKEEGRAKLQKEDLLEYIWLMRDCKEQVSRQKVKVALELLRIRLQKTEQREPYKESCQQDEKTLQMWLREPKVKPMRQMVTIFRNELKTSLKELMLKENFQIQSVKERVELQAENALAATTDYLAKRVKMKAMIEVFESSYLLMHVASLNDIDGETEANKGLTKIRNQVKEALQEIKTEEDRASGLSDSDSE